MPFKLGPLEIVLILAIIVVIFGVGKLPQVGSAIGKSLRSFKEAQSSLEAEPPKPRRKAVKRIAARSSKAPAKK